MKICTLSVKEMTWIFFFCPRKFHSQNWIAMSNRQSFLHWLGQEPTKQIHFFLKPFTDNFYPYHRYFSHQRASSFWQIPYFFIHSNLHRFSREQSFFRKKVSGVFLIINVKSTSNHFIVNKQLNKCKHYLYRSALQWQKINKTFHPQSSPQRPQP